MKCDFCSSGDLPVATFGCATFTYNDAFLGDVISEGAWKACATCAALVKAQAWDELLKRGVETFVSNFDGVPLPGLRDLVVTLHQGFRDHRLQVQ